MENEIIAVLDRTISDPNRLREKLDAMGNRSILDVDENTWDDFYRTVLALNIKRIRHQNTYDVVRSHRLELPEDEEDEVYDD